VTSQKVCKTVAEKLQKLAIFISTVTAYISAKVFC